MKQPDKSTVDPSNVIWAEYPVSQKTDQNHWEKRPSYGGRKTYDIGIDRYQVTVDVCYQQR